MLRLWVLNAHLNVILYNWLSAYKRVGLPEEFHPARPKWAVRMHGVTFCSAM
jgi:hypothetical protein